MSATEPLELLDGDAWEAWLAEHHHSAADAWLRIGKKNADVTLLGIGDALDGALCFGWIDGQRKGLDNVSFLQRYCPRRARSTWSQLNVAKAEALIAAGRMRPAGFAEVERARADGRWESAYESQATAVVPDDLVHALVAEPRAWEAFERLGRSEKYAVILPLLLTRSAEARAHAVAKAVLGLV